MRLISEVIDKSIHNQTQDCLKRDGLLYIYQSGSTANPSIDTCLSRSKDIILNGAENGKQTGMILIDLQKAFGTLDHNILLAKNEVHRLFR